MLTTLLRALTLALLAAASSALAQADPPGRVGRISLAAEGTALRVGEAAVSGNASLNWPVSTGATVETRGGARTEARIGSTAIRLDGNTAVDLVELSDELIWLRLNYGSLALRIISPEHAAEMVVETPQGRIRFGGRGQYRIDALPSATAVTAYSGAATVEDIGLPVRAGERVEFFGTTDRSYLSSQPANDNFNQWNLAREQMESRVPGPTGISELTGYEELAQYGDWRQNAEYGTVWVPRSVPTGWAPYRWGRWAWVSPWGWTWIDDSPWGFAPSHYGRWVLMGASWAWVPGSLAARPIYAPAVVGWIGEPGWSVSFSIGAAPAVGWFPLGPREPFYPYYRASLGHVHHLNRPYLPSVGHIVSVTPPPGGGRYVYHGHPGAVTVVPGSTLTAGTPVYRAPAPVHPPAGLSKTPVVQAPTVAPPPLPPGIRVPPVPREPALLEKPHAPVDPVPGSRPSDKTPQMVAPSQNVEPRGSAGRLGTAPSAPQPSPRPYSLTPPDPLPPTRQGPSAPAAVEPRDIPTQKPVYVAPRPVETPPVYREAPVRRSEPEPVRSYQPPPAQMAPAPKPSVPMEAPAAREPRNSGARHEGKPGAAHEPESGGPQRMFK